MGYMLERCPQVYHGCFLSLRRAAVLAGVLGLLWAALYLFLFSAAGARLVARGTGAGKVAGALQHAHGALGVLLAALHALLLAGAAAESDALCDVYVWGMLACWAGQLLAALTYAAASVQAGNALPATLVLFAVLLTVMVSFYFVIVVINFRLTIP